MTRRLVAACVAIAFGLLGFAGAAGLFHSLIAAGVAGAVVAGCAAWAATRWLFEGLSEAESPRPLKILSGVAAAVALVQLARLTIFAVAPSQVWASAFPSSGWEARHCCATAYYVAAQAAAEGRNAFDTALYNAPDDDPTRARKPRMIGPFGVDVYEYPPTFLPLPRAVGQATGDFFHFRMTWFALNAMAALLAMLVVARLLGPLAGMRALLLVPLAWAAVPMASALQKGNFQLMAIALSMLAMAAFARGRAPWGGALLAFTTAGKLFPGVLALYLLARRQWRAAAWTAAMGLALALLTAADLGLAPFVDFLGHLPGLLGGESFPAFRNPNAVAINHSVPGLVFKLRLFEVPGMGFPAAKAVGWIWTAFLLAAVAFAARRRIRDGAAPLVWLSLLVLATLRSPFLPQAYAVFPTLWLLTLAGAMAAPSARTYAAIAGGFLALNVYWPLDWGAGPRALAIASTVPQLLTAALAVVALWRHTAPAPAAAPEIPAAALEVGR